MALLVFTVTADGVCDGAIVLVRFHQIKFYTVLLNEKVSDFLSRVERDK